MTRTVDDAFEEMETDAGWAEKIASAPTKLEQLLLSYHQALSDRLFKIADQMKQAHDLSTQAVEASKAGDHQKAVELIAQAIEAEDESCFDLADEGDRLTVEIETRPEREHEDE